MISNNFRFRVTPNQNINLLTGGVLGVISRGLRLKAHLQPTGIARRGKISICENPVKAEIYPITSLYNKKCEFPYQKSMVEKPISIIIKST